MTELVVNDLFVELREENERLLNELMVSKKCIELMQNYRNCLNSFNENCICGRNKDQNKQTLNALELKYKSIESEIKGIVKSAEENRSNGEKASELALNSNKNLIICKQEKSLEVISEDLDIEYKEVLKQKPKNFSENTEELKCEQNIDLNQLNRNLSENVCKSSDESIVWKIVEQKDKYIKILPKVIPKIVAKTDPNVNLRSKSRKRSYGNEASTCNQCNKVFKNNYGLQIHYRSAHLVKPINIDKKSQPFLAILPKIQLKLTEEQTKQLPNHSVEPNQQNPELNTIISTIPTNTGLVNVIKCPQISCNKLFVSEEYLQKHINTDHKSPQTIPAFNVSDNLKTNLNKTDKTIRKTNNKNKVLDTNVVKTTFNALIKCPNIECNQLFSNEEYFRNHMKSVHKTDCKIIVNINPIEQNFNQSNRHLNYVQNFDTNPINREQIKYETTVKPFKCLVIGCNASFDREESEETHRMRAHPIDKIFKCVYIGCDKRFLTKKLSVFHFRRHLREKREFVCSSEGCHFKSEHIISIIGHLNKHSADKPFKCSYDLCQASFVTEDNLDRHVKIVHQNLYQVKCKFPNCNRLFKTSQALESHKLVHMKCRPYSCDHPNCEYSTKSEMRLRAHQRIHMNRPLLRCTVDGCVKSFRDKYYLKLHIRRHMNKDRYKCEFDGCAKVFKSRYTMKAHQIYHTDQFVECDWPGCEYKNRFSVNVRNHRKNVHSNNRPFGCEWPGCDKRFKSKVHLGIHLRSHNNDKPYACHWPGCEYRCTTNGNLTKHKKNHQRLR